MQIRFICIIKKYLFFLPVFFLFGCGVWGDFTTYFNLYYNASNIFTQAEDAIKAQNIDLFSTAEINIPGSATQLLNKVIQKTSQILQFHSESAYIDNSLLMLGKSFYYQKNYLKALRKFQELIATRPESNLILETKLWIGKTQMKLKSYPDALEILESVRKQGTDEGENEIAIDAYIEEIKYKLIQEDYAGAITSAKELLNVSDDDEINADVVYEMGLLYNLLNDPENAIAAFQQVFDYSPSFETEFDARLELGKAYRDAGQPEKALDLFTDMRYRKNYSDSYDQVDLQLGITQADLQNYSKALSYFQIVDTGYTSSKSTGLAKYHLGELYQYNFSNYDSASYYYSKALTSQLPPEYIIKANEKIQRFRKYKTLHDNLSQNYKKLNYALNPETFVKDSIAFYSDTVKTEEQNQQQSNSTLNNSLSGRGRNRNLSEETETRVNQNNNSSTKNSTTNNNTAVRIPPIRPNISSDSIKALLVQNLFDLGNLFFTEFNIPDSAYYYYSTILSDYPESNYKAKTLYALGSYYETENENVKADSLYNIIYNNYKNENIVNAAADKLKKPLITLNYDPAVDLYANAEKELNDDNYKESISQFYNIYKSYPQSSLAPKALYATGWILANQLNKPDSAALFYDTITVKYPGSIYAAKVSSEISFYNQENARIKKAYEDSIKLVQNVLADSLKADSLRTLNKLSNGKTPSDTTEIFNRLSNDSLTVDTVRTLNKDNTKNPISPDIRNKKLDEGSIDTTSIKRGSRREVEPGGNDIPQKDVGKTLDSLKASERKLEE